MGNLIRINRFNLWLIEQHIGKYVGRSHLVKLIITSLSSETILNSNDHTDHGACILYSIRKKKKIQYKHRTYKIRLKLMEKYLKIHSRKMHPFK